MRVTWRKLLRGLQRGGGLVEAPGVEGEPTWATDSCTSPATISAGPAVLHRRAAQWYAAAGDRSLPNTGANHWTVTPRTCAARPASARFPADITMERADPS